MTMDTVWGLMTTERLKGISLNDLVGGGDAKGVGQLSCEVLWKLGAVGRESRVLDIGCGCGRTAAALAPYLLPTASFVGVDIIPGLVSFCRREITSRHPNFQFHTLRQDNPKYSEFIDHDANIVLLEDIEDLDQDFDLVTAFSVFTHLDRAATVSMLDTIWNRLKNEATAVLSFFILNPFSRASVASARSNLFRGGMDVSANVVIDTFNGPNSAVGFDESTLLDMILESKFQRPQSIHYGNWNCAPGLHYQDLVVLRKELPVPADFDPEAYLVANPDVQLAGMNPFFHYREFGRREGRRTCP
ncbi:class I SAM-dependent methyltransferase [Rhodopila sp.]|uniref:class I SAM-dependent methyltransferase n=1 Tax=Rhodopila sp. TaxID=2480087 RepID=UPI003D129FC2